MVKKMKLSYKKDYDVLTPKQQEAREWFDKENEKEEEVMEEDNTIICPVCKQVVSDFDEGINDPCEHVMLIYTDCCSDEFVHVGNSAEDIAEGLMANYEYQTDNELDTSLPELMQAYAEDEEDVIVLELTTSGMSCGPCSSTEYVMFKLK